MKAIIDLDWPKYAVASVGETRTIQVIHKSSGRERVFNNRTEFWGKSPKKNGGWLAELNEGRDSPFTPEEFDIIDKQEVTEPIQNVLHSAKQMVDASLKKMGATGYKAFIGKGDSFRVNLSTLQKYKGGRDNLLRPLLLDEVTEYLTKKYDPEIITGIEADDACVMAAYKDKDSSILGVDKDYYGCPVNFFNYNIPEEGIVNCNGFGKLWVDDKGKVRGTGRLFKYFQVCSGDSSDDYKANYCSSMKWGDKNAFNVLSQCKDDREAFRDMKHIFQMLYPEPKIITSWQGNEIEIDWLYVMKEMFDMAHLHRWENDFIDVEKVLRSYEFI